MLLREKVSYYIMLEGIPKVKGNQLPQLYGFADRDLVILLLMI